MQGYEPRYALSKMRDFAASRSMLGVLTDWLELNPMKSYRRVSTNRIITLISRLFLRSWLSFLGDTQLLFDRSAGQAGDDVPVGENGEDDEGNGRYCRSRGHVTIADAVLLNKPCDADRDSLP